MNKSIITYIAVTTIALSPMVAFASQILPATGESYSSATPATDDSSSTARPAEWSEVITTSSATPETSNSSSSATPATGDSSSTAVAPVNSPAPVTNNSSSGSYSGSSGTSRVNVNNCPLITTFMRYGGNNDNAQVTKLQSFLKNTEKLELDINGTFDKKTENAVVAFQNKYSAVTMSPWGATKGTGQVYITTLKQINKLACNQSLTLNTSELATIEAYKNARKENVAPESIIVTPTKAPTTDLNNDTDKDADSVGTLEDGEQNTASVAKTSIASRFWNFVVGLFK